MLELQIRVARLTCLHLRIGLDKAFTIEPCLDLKTAFEKCMLRKFQVQVLLTAFGARAFELEPRPVEANKLFHL